MISSGAERYIHTVEVAGSNPASSTDAFMVLTPHMLIGAAIGSQSKSIFWAFCFGLISHYILDAMPHWEYLRHLKQIKKPKNLLKILIDFFIGLFIVFLFIGLDFNSNKLILIFTGIIAAILPDILQVIIYFLKLKYLNFLSILHDKIHNKKDLLFLENLLIMILIFLLFIFILKT